jgi:hypothetical protein
VAVSLLGITSFAQDETVIEIQDKNGPYVTGAFWDNWFISAGGGVQVYFGNGDNSENLGKRLAPALDISVGKWITPSVGVRLQYSGLQAKDYNEDKFNTMNLLDWDIKEISSVFGALSDRGIVDGNEVRDRLGMSPRDGLDELRILENYIPYDMSGQQKKLVQEG